MTIALCMIVRNESAIIGRCLASVRDLVDTWVICDTGSEDATREEIHAGLEGIDGQLHDTTWVNFGHNRSALLQHARGAADYLLLLDADHVVHQRAELPPLDLDAYALREIGSLDYAVVRLVDGHRRWWYEGSTHEYIATDGQFTQGELPALLLEHHADGASREEKLLRDVGLLKRDVADDPGNTRAVFYLAQTYRDLGRDELAIRHYLRRAAAGGWAEEVFYAGLQAGTLLARTDIDEATPVLLRAWQTRPSRAEPLYELARAHRLLGHFELAAMFAARGREIPYPDDVLFIHRDVYDWGLDLEHGLALAGLGQFDEARLALEDVLTDGDLDAETRADVIEAVEALPGSRAHRVARADDEPARLAALAPSVRIGEIKIDVTPDWPAFNPSIAPDGDGFRMIVRTANYHIEKGVLHDDGVLHTINYLVALDANLAVTAIEPIVDDFDGPGPQRHPTRIRGYEDMRLFEVDGRWYASATVADFNVREWREVALLGLDGAGVKSAVVLQGPEPRRHEKNWMPFAHDGAPAFVYACAPTLILAGDPSTGATTAIAEHEGPAMAEHFRGSSQGVDVGEGLVFVVHETFLWRGMLRYVHRFVLLDRTFAVAAVSAPFTFSADPVEFCAGMARRGADELVLSFGVSDVAAGLAVLSVDEALGLLEPVRGGSLPSGDGRDA